MNGFDQRITVIEQRQNRNEQQINRIVDTLTKNNMTTLTGKVSWFGGPEDTGVSPNEGLAFIYDVEDAPWLFLPEQPPGTSGLARRLDPSIHYIACRWDYDQTPKSMLPGMVVQVRSTRTGQVFKAFPADWGPHVDTDRVADISPGLMEALGIQTDDEVEVYFPYHEAIEETPMPYPAIVISSGHGKYVRGASGILDEVDEARKVVERLADQLGARGVEVTTFHDDTSHSQDENLHTIVAFHNSRRAISTCRCTSTPSNRSRNRWAPRSCT